MSDDDKKDGKKINLVNDIPEIVRGISTTYGIPKKDAEEIVNDVFNSIKDIASENGQVGLKNFGSFKIRRKARMRYFNFGTQQIEEIDRNVLVFYPSTGFKDLVNSVAIGDDGIPKHSKKKKESKA